jgi:hypothetical protein
MYSEFNLYSRVFHLIRRALFLVFLVPVSLPGQTPVPIYDRSVHKLYYFPIDRSELLRDYANNAVELDSLDRLLGDPAIYPRIDSIRIIAASSPIASPEYNLRLSQKRAAALRDYILQQHPQIEETRFSIQAAGIDWAGFSSLVESDPFLPSQSKILALLKEEPDEGSILIRLRSVGGKATYSYLLERVYPRLQYTSFSIRLDDGSCIPPCDHSPMKTYIEKISIVHDTVYLPCPPCPPLAEAVEPPTAASSVAKKTFYLGLKTNLLYTAGLLPNLSVEIPLNKTGNWSMVVTGNWSWWDFGGNSRNYHRIQAAGLEVRRWFAPSSAPSSPFTGHAVGIYALVGTYDVRLFPKDNESKGGLSNRSYSGGLSYAYSLSLARRIKLEFSLSAGYFGGRYYDYKFHVNEEHARWEWTAIRDRHYWGVTGAGISVVWMIGRFNDFKKGGAQ